jgi:two-component system, cell cycle sensor histidine kinase and response regulator CckA
MTVEGREEPSETRRDSDRFTSRLLDAIRRAHEQYLTTDETRPVFRFLLETLVSMTKSEYGFLDEVLRDEEGKLYKLSLALSEIAWDEESRRLYGELAARSLEFRNLDNLSGAPAVTGELIIANDPPHDPRSGGLPSGHPPLTCYMGMPLVFGGELVGVAGIANRPGGYDEALAEQLSPFLSTCASLIQAARQRERDRMGKLAEEALRKSEAKFRAAFLTSPDSININRLSDGLYLDVNDGFLQITGYDREEVLGRSSTELGIWADDKDRKRLGIELEKNGFVENLEANFRCKDGTIRSCLMSARVIEMDGEPCILFITRDISDRVALEAQLVHAQKMESVGRLAGGVAHDFNNLLTVINGHTDIVISEMDESDPFYSDLKEVRDAGDRAATLTRQLLAFSRKQIVDPQVLSLNDLIVNLSKMLTRVIGEDIELELILRDDLGAVRVDRGQFEQVLVNLAVNARDAMPEGGHLIIETANVDLGEEHRRRNTEAIVGPAVMLTVSDTGEGMTEETKEHLFEPFYTTKPVGQGTGLGLATIYGVVKQAGGSIEVSSEVGAGTSFEISLPRVLEAPTRAKPSGRDLVMMGGAETVFLVEDEEIVRKMVLKVLLRLGYHVFEAANGEQALASMAAMREPIDLLITDVVMPGMNGRQLADQVAELHPETKVLFTSGYTEDIVVHHGVLEEGLSFLGKPYSPQMLASKIREVLKRG